MSKHTNKSTSSLHDAMTEYVIVGLAVVFVILSALSQIF